MKKRGFWKRLFDIDSGPEVISPTPQSVPPRREVPPVARTVSEAERSELRRKSAAYREERRQATEALNMSPAVFDAAVSASERDSGPAHHHSPSHHGPSHHDQGQTSTHHTSTHDAPSHHTSTHHDTTSHTIHHDFGSSHHDFGSGGFDGGSMGF